VINMEVREAVKMLERKYKYVIPSALVRVEDVEITWETVQREINPSRLKQIEWLIANEGQADPIYVTLKNGKWVLLYGLEELEVFKRKGIEMIEAKILEGDRKRVLTVLLKILESRKNLNPMELAENFEMLKAETGLTWKELSKLTGYSETHIHEIRQIYHCEYEDIKQLVKERKMSIRNALKEIRRRRKQEKGEVITEEDVVEEWEEQVFRCPICNNTTVKGDSVRVCNTCAYVLRKVVEIMRERGFESVEQVADYLLNLTIEQAKREQEIPAEIESAEDFEFRIGEDVNT